MALVVAVVEVAAVATVVVVEVAAVVESGRVDPGSTWLNYE